MTLPAGSKLGPYEILGQIGAGGMGEVYRARDTRLAREVAIKVLPASFSNDADRLKRFEQEAKAAGALSHPNITAVYDIGTHEGAPYVVQELLEGETLRERISGTALAPRRAIEIAKQIASGLAAAHEKGIVHRDLKPENVFITSDARVKILDFGIAKLTHPETAAGSQTNLPTLTPGTEPGVVIGTIGYMSPEQVRGKSVDQRTDIFSFGAILYEMLSGRRAFKGDTAADTMTAILKEDPPELSETNKNVPPALERIVRHCLEKSPEARFRSASDIAFDLEAISGTSAETRAHGATKGSFKKYVRAVLGAVAAAGLLAIAYRAGIRTGHGAVQRPSLQAFFTQLTSEPGIEDFPSLSPDGKLLAYVSRASGNSDIYVLRVGGKNPINLTKDEPADDTQPAFSPDGSQIAFRSERQGGGIFLIGATGESVRRLTAAGYSPTWSPDGKEIVYATEGILDPLNRGATSELWSFDVASGKTRRLYMGDAAQPSVSPHGLRIAYWGLPFGSRRDIFTIPIQGLKPGEKPVPVTNDEAVDWDPVWSPDGTFLYFGSNRGGSLNLWRVPMDEATGRPLGQPEPLTTPARWSGFFSITRDGRQIAYLALNPLTTIEKVGFDPVAGKISGAPTTLFRGSLLMTEPNVSPDGQWIALRTRGGQDDLYLLKQDGSALRQITSDTYRDRAPTWSPDGQRIAFHSDRSGSYEIWTIQPDGSGLTQISRSKGHEALAPRWSSDGKRIAWEDGDRAGVINLGKEPGLAAEELLPRPSEGLGFFPWSWSPDGRLLFGNVAGAASPDAGIWLYSLESRSYEKLTERGSDPVLLRDGEVFLFLDHGQVFLHDRRDKKSRLVVPGPAESPINTFALSPDNRWICVIRDVSEGDVWMAALR